VPSAVLGPAAARYRCIRAASSAVRPDQQSNRAGAGCDNDTIKWASKKSSKNLLTCYVDRLVCRVAGRSSTRKNPVVLTDTFIDTNYRKPSIPSWGGPLPSRLLAINKFLVIQSEFPEARHICFRYFGCLCLRESRLTDSCSFNLQRTLALFSSQWESANFGTIQHTYVVEGAKTAPIPETLASPLL